MIGQGLHSRRQRGAIAPASAGLLALLLLFVALAADTGRLFYEKRRLQQHADLSALQAAQLYCAGFDNVSAITQTVNETLNDHGFDTDAAGNSVAIDIGKTVLSGISRQFVDNSATDSVRVTLGRTIAASLFAGSVFNDITLTATSTAERDVIGTLSAGTNLVTLDSTQSSLLNSLLGGLLGSSINISLVGYQGLLDANISLLAIRDEFAGLNIVAESASMNELLAVSVSLGEWLQVLRASLQQDDGVPSATLSAMDEMISVSTASGHSSRPVDLGDLLAYGGDDSTSEQALATGIGGLQTVLASLLQINEGDTVPLDPSIDPSGDTLLNALLGDTLDLDLIVNSAPRIAVGPFGYDENGLPKTEASTGDLDILVGLTIPDPDASGSLAGILTGTLSFLADIEGDLALLVDAGVGSAWLDRVDQCPRLLDKEMGYTVASDSTLSEIKLGSPSNPDNPGTLDVRLLLGLVDIPLDVSADGVLTGGSGTDSYLIDLADPDALPAGSNAGTTTASELMQNSTIDVDGSLTSAELNAIAEDLLRPLLVGVADLALDPLLELLGITLGGVEYQVMDIDEGGGELKI